MLIGIVAHKSRRDMAYELFDHVNADFINVDEGDAQTHEESLRACIDNHYTVLSELYKRARPSQYVIVLEDDALPVDDFRLHAKRALKHVPLMAGFYIGMAGGGSNGEALEHAISKGVCWATANHLVSAVAYAIKASILGGLIKQYPLLGGSVERRITDWANKNEIGPEPRFYYTLPSLVDHRDSESIIFPGSDGGMRRAWKVGIPDEWNGLTVPYDA